MSKVVLLTAAGLIHVISFANWINCRCTAIALGAHFIVRTSHVLQCGSAARSFVLMRKSKVSPMAADKTNFSVVPFNYLSVSDTSNSIKAILTAMIANKAFTAGYFTFTLFVHSISIILPPQLLCVNLGEWEKKVQMYANCCANISTFRNIWHFCFDPFVPNWL